MFAALLAALLFAVSAICGYRSSRQIGGAEANLWRIVAALIFLALWAHLFGTGLAGVAFPYFVISGFFGVGLGDTSYFQALPRLGSRRTVLLMQCFTPIFAILIEWLWLDTRLTVAQFICVAVILSGVAIALAPSDHAQIPRRQFWIGIAFTVFAALTNGLGAVFTRKAYFVAHAANEFPDPGTAGYQRVLGGVLLPAIILLAAKWKSAPAHGGVFEEKTMHVSREKWKRIWPWILANALAGQTLGMTCVQWALDRTPTGIVMTVTAMTPVILLPMSRIVENEKIGIRSLLGALVAVAGVIGLTFLRIK
jgi:drug/metabolite transporter (DMT)-like permease